MKVTTVAGAPQSGLSTPAAVYVISGEEIQRSGHRTIAGALRREARCVQAIVIFEMEP